MRVDLGRSGGYARGGVRPVAAALAVLVVGGWLSASAVGARQVPVNTPDPSSGGVGPVARRGDQQSATDLKSQQRAEQRRRIALDAAKLVTLSNALKAELDGTPNDQLPVSALRKAGEIEKTAHDLNGWMKY